MLFHLGGVHMPHVCSDTPCTFGCPLVYSDASHMSDAPSTSVCPPCPLYICVSRGYLHMIWGWGHLCTPYVWGLGPSAHLSDILVSVRHPWPQSVG